MLDLIEVVERFCVESGSFGPSVNVPLSLRPSPADVRDIKDEASDMMCAPNPTVWYELQAHPKLRKTMSNQDCTSMRHPIFDFVAITFHIAKQIQKPGYYYDDDDEWCERCWRSRNSAGPLSGT